MSSCCGWWVSEQLVVCSFGGSHQKDVARSGSSFEWDRADLKRGIVATLKNGQVTTHWFGVGSASPA